MEENKGMKKSIVIGRVVNSDKEIGNVRYLESIKVYYINIGGNSIRLTENELNEVKSGGFMREVLISIIRDYIEVSGPMRIEINNEQIEIPLMSRVKVKILSNRGDNK